MEDRILPYFMKNKSWYVCDGTYGYIVLTRNAPAEAVQSYNEYKEEMLNKEEWFEEDIQKFSDLVEKNNWTQEDYDEYQEFQEKDLMDLKR